MSMAPRVEARTDAFAASDSAESLLYLYCVLESGSAAQRLLAERRVPGMAPAEPLFPIETAGLVAAVSRVPAATFGEEPLNALLAELPRLAPLVVQHEETVRALLPVAPALLPMTFGAIYRGPERVLALLRERGSEFHRLLKRLRGRQEWGLKVFADPARLLEAAEAASEELCRLEEETLRSGPGRAYLIGKRRERLIAGEADRLLRQLLQEIEDRLATLAVSIRRDQPISAEKEAVPLVLKSAFLVDVGAAERFRGLAGELAHEFGARGLALDVSGPWAPYSFVADDRGAV